MTGKDIRLDIVTPSGDGLSKTVSYLQVPASMGLLGILPNHAPLMTTLTTGVIKYKENEAEHFLAVSDGFLEVKDNVVTVLVNYCNLAEDIDLARAESARDRADSRLNGNSSEEEIDTIRAKRALDKANNRIAAYQKLKK